MAPRRGRLFALTIDEDAAAILLALAPGSKHYGQLVSELLRQELSRRQERRAIMAELVAEARTDLFARSA
jgi:hypothetical protein